LWKALTRKTGRCSNESIDKPLLNRALRGTYPPGSTYKPFMAMAALETGTRTPQTLINDPGFYMFGGNRFGSPENERGGIMDMRRAIVESSNVYFYSLANELGVDTMHDFMAPLGFGQITGIDINGEVRGVPTQPSLEAQILQAPRAAKVVRRRDDFIWVSVRATTASPCCRLPRRCLPGKQRRQAQTSTRHCNAGRHDHGCAHLWRQSLLLTSPSSRKTSRWSKMPWLV